MENLDEREVHPVVHPEDGDRRQVWGVHAVDGEEHNNEAKEGPAHYVARVTLQSDQVPPISSCWEKERSELNPNYLPGQIVSRTLFLSNSLLRFSLCPSINSSVLILSSLPSVLPFSFPATPR